MTTKCGLVLDVGHLVLVVRVFSLSTTILVSIVVVSVSVWLIKVLFLAACMRVSASILILTVAALVATGVSRLA